MRLVHLSAIALHALATADLDAANRASTVVLPPYFIGPDWTSTWRRRSEQIKTDPSCAQWITGVIWDLEGQNAVGRAGYHGPPDENGMVEVGYAVAPGHQRKGYGCAALEALLERAAHASDVRIVRASISPDNLASRRLVEQYGFLEVGEQWDDEDGLETIYEFRL